MDESYDQQQTPSSLVTPTTSILVSRVHVLIEFVMMNERIGEIFVCMSTSKQASKRTNERAEGTRTRRKKKFVLSIRRCSIGVDRPMRKCSAQPTGNGKRIIIIVNAHSPPFREMSATRQKRRREEKQTFFSHSSFVLIVLKRMEKKQHSLRNEFFAFSSSSSRWFIWINKKGKNNHWRRRNGSSLSLCR